VAAKDSRAIFNWLRVRSKVPNRHYELTHEALICGTLRRSRHLIAIQLVTLVLLIGSRAENVGGQQSESIRLGVRVGHDSSALTRPTKISRQSDSDTTSTRASRTARGAIIGALIGVGTGIVVAFIDTHKATVTDHSEDGLALVAYTVIGALAGFAVGGIVGFFWH
jgi:hypothetical protein